MATSWRRNALLFAITLFRAVYAAHNETVDDTSPTIEYVGTWLSSHTQPTRFNSTTHYTRVQGSYASFSFTGATRIYFMGYGLLSSSPDPTTEVTLDGTSYIVDQTRASSERAQAIMWSSGTLDPNARHTIVCTKTSGNATNTMDLNIDAFILTVPDPGDVVATTASSPSPDTSTIQPSTTSTTSQSSPSSASTALIWAPTDGGVAVASSGAPFSSQSPASSHTEQTTTPRNTAAVVGGTLGGLAVLAVVAAFCFFLGRNKRIRAESKEMVNDEGPISVNPRPNPMPSTEESRQEKTTFRPANSTVISDATYMSGTENSVLAPAPPAYSPEPSLPHTV